MDTLRVWWGDYFYDRWGEYLRDVVLIVIVVFLTAIAAATSWADFDRVFISGVAFTALQHVVAYLRGRASFPDEFDPEHIPFE